MILAWVLILSVWWALPAEADCSGSGLVWSCAAGTTISQINTRYGQASDNAVFTFASGSYSWTSGTIGLIQNKGLTMICGTPLACTVTLGSDTFWDAGSLDGPFDKLTRLSGFTFTGGTCFACIWFFSINGAALNTQLSQIRIDHNHFNNVGGANGETDLIYFGSGDREAKFMGVVDNNTFTKTGSGSYRIVMYGTGDPSRWSGSLLGVNSTNNCIFYEDNVINQSNPGNSGFTFLDGESAACWVVRGNTFVNARIASHGVTHGWGATSWEAYLNTFTRDKNTADGLGDAYRTFHNQGSGTYMNWGNRINPFTSINSNAIDLLHYRDTTIANHGASGSAEICDGTNGLDGNVAPTATNRGYPCYHQPGRTPTRVLNPIAVFLNVNTDTSAKVDEEFSCPWSAPEYCAQHMQENRDYYNAVSASAQSSSTSPFNGTVGIGHGTLANRPTTCTHNAPPGLDGGGVMYWATDQGSWNSSASNPAGVNAAGADGVLYQCSAANTWTLYYTPAPYPHPLQGGTAPAIPHVRSHGATSFSGKVGVR